VLYTDGLSIPAKPRSGRAALRVGDAWRLTGLWRGGIGSARLGNEVVLIIKLYQSVEGQFNNTVWLLGKLVLSHFEIQVELLVAESYLGRENSPALLDLDFLFEALIKIDCGCRTSRPERIFLGHPSSFGHFIDDEFDFASASHIFNHDGFPLHNA
jgi:hypothetical protein